MGLFQQALLTYDAMAPKYMGKYLEEFTEPLAPIFHVIVPAKIIITIKENGEFQSAEKAQKGLKIIVPATIGSAERTSGGASKRPHPLCDKLSYYLAEENYFIPQLESWVNSPYCHPKANAILRYVKSSSMQDDLTKSKVLSYKKDKIAELDDFIGWRVLSDKSSDIPECWKDKSLFDSYIQYYKSSLDIESGLCMVTGENIPIAPMHPGLLRGKTKLVSSDGGNANELAYKGRFNSVMDATTIGYETSQKVHAALRWIGANQSISFYPKKEADENKANSGTDGTYGGRIFVCWSPEGAKLHSAGLPLILDSKKYAKYSDFKDDLKKTLLGKKECLPQNSKAVIASFDVASKGRLSITYCNELDSSDFLQRLRDWDERCCWWFGDSIFNPFLPTIINCAFGTQRKSKTEKGKYTLVTDEKIFGQHLQRLLSCRVDKKKIPYDIVHCLVSRASMPQVYDITIWRQIVFTACAVIQHYYAPTTEEDLFMNWSLERPNRSFQFGRLLAVMEHAEEQYYAKTGESRQTMAIKSLTAFHNKPLDTAERVNRHINNAYLDRIHPRQKKIYQEKYAEIISLICSCSDSTTINSALEPEYLIGYELQRNEFFKKSQSKDKKKEEETE